MGRHARPSPSKLHQVLECTASLALEDNFPDEESPYAAEGTAGHAMAEHLIKKYLKIRSKRPVSDYYSDTLLEAVDEYVSYVQEQIELARKECEDPYFAVEKKVSLEGYLEDCYGTADMVVMTDSKVHVIDLKLGQGVAVSSENNPQLMAYGLGLLLQADLMYDIKTVELTIVQPRLNSLSSWEIDADALREWGMNVLVPKVTEARSGDATFGPGPTTCRFCKARFQCKARAEYFMALAEHDFEEPELLTDEEMADVLVKADALKKWVEEVYAFAQNEAIIHDKHWPGFKLVRGKSNRKYTNEDDVIQAANEAGYEDIFKKSLIGIGDMERLMGKKKFQEIIGEKYIYKPEGKVVLASADDKREEVTINSAEADFEE